MGKNKALIRIDGITIMDRTLALFNRFFEETIVVTGEKEKSAPLDAKVYEDLIPNQGVLGGLYTGLFFSSFFYSFCVACDMPFVKESVIEYLIKQIQGFDAIVPRTNDGLQPLHAIYSKNCLEPIKKTIERGKRQILEFYPHVRTKIVNADQFCNLEAAMESFVNINTPEELLSVRKRYGLR